MRRLLHPLLLGLGLVPALLASCSREDPEAPIRASFEGYREAVLVLNGKRAREHVDSTTIRYYEHLLGLVLDGGWEEVDALPPTDRLAVLQIRLTFPPEALRGMTGEELFVQAVRRGLIARQTVEDVRLGTIRFEDGVAFARCVTAGTETPYEYAIREEDGSWRLDLTSLLPSENLALAQAIQASGKSEREFVTRVLGAVTGKEVTEELWVPVGR